MAKLKLVKKLRAREVNTKFGQRTVTSWVVSEEGQELTKIADIWGNEPFAEGQFIYGTVEEKGEYNGKMQYQVRLETSSSKNGNKQSGPSELEKENNAMLKEILSILKGNYGAPF